MYLWALSQALVLGDHRQGIQPAHPVDLLLPPAMGARLRARRIGLLGMEPTVVLIQKWAQLIEVSDRPGAHEVELVAQPTVGMHRLRIQSRQWLGVQRLAVETRIARRGRNADNGGDLHGR